MGIQYIDMAAKTIPTRLPKSLYQYFWEVDPTKVNPQRSPEYVINRLLNRGGVEAVRWTRRQFPKEEIIQTLKIMRDFSSRSAFFWSSFYNIPEKEMICLQEPYLTMRKERWPY